MSDTASNNGYWRSTLWLTLGLLLVWAVAGLGCGVLLADWLNQWYLPGTGYPLGFWMAQQGSIIVFVVLILVYAVGMNALDRKHRQAGPEATEPTGEQATEDADIGSGI